MPATFEAAASIPSRSTPFAAEPLTALARIAQHATAPSRMPSLSLQLASAIAQLGSFLTIRGETRNEHYFAQALTLACLQPTTSDIKPYEAALLAFIRFDRRDPRLPYLVDVPGVAVMEAPAIHFIHSLREQSGFQPLYNAANDLDRYGAVTRSRRKLERLVVLSREIAGRPLLAPASAIEEMYFKLAS